MSFPCIPIGSSSHLSRIDKIVLYYSVCKKSVSEYHRQYFKAHVSQREITSAAFDDANSELYAAPRSGPGQELKSMLTTTSGGMKGPSESEHCRAAKTKRGGAGPVLCHAKPSTQKSNHLPFPRRIETLSCRPRTKNACQVRRQHPL